MISTLDIAWLAGIIEGEGCITSHSHKYKSKQYKYPRLRIVMTDLDVIQRIAKLFKCTWHSKRRTNNFTVCKIIYDVDIINNQAVPWLMTIYPLMGQRRQAQIRVVLNNWKEI